MTRTERAVGGTKDAEAIRFSYVHVVGFEDTNLVGNVYFTRHVGWQGRCRELFLKEHAPGILDELAADLRLVTLKVECEYFEEIRAFDRIEVLMSLRYLQEHRIGLDFEYRRLGENGYSVVATGFQEVACMKADGARLSPAMPPPALDRALCLAKPAGQG